MDLRFRMERHKTMFLGRGRGLQQARRLGEEPVLAARIRYLPEVVKFERVEIRTKCRGRGYGHLLFRFMIDFSRRKGYDRLYLHAQSRPQQFYEGYGFHTVGSPFVFSDHAYVEMLASGMPK
ncbi:GNAT family N-acetyltransferase [Salinispora fenicalii]|uniref:GNAT family N-acetyltransferase n=1 Tax=Salinispora fenicalii TaxID=1137263 RepID=UPI001CC662A0|nr:GNAT family N-acetyltransferase [Salinispora fenicalii]